MTATATPTEWSTLAQSLSFTLGLAELPLSLTAALRDASDADRAALLRIVTAAGSTESDSAGDIAQLLGVAELPADAAIVVTLALSHARIHFEPCHVVIDLGAGCWELSAIERRALPDLAALLTSEEVRHATLRVLLDGVRRRGRARVFSCGQARLAIEPDRVALDLGEGMTELSSTEVRSLGSLRELLSAPIVSAALGGAR